MNKEIQRQKEFWDSEYQAFDSIYSHKRSTFANLLDSIFRKDMYERYDFTMKHSEPIQDRVFLDVGCGTGQYAIPYAKKGARKVVGLDIAPNMISASNEYAVQNNVEDKCEFILTDLLDFNPDTKYDVTIGIGLFDYIKDPLPVIKKMAEVTKDKVIMAFPRSNTWRAPIRKVRLTLKGCDVYFFSKSQIIDLLEASGLNEYMIEKVGKLYCVVASSK